MPECTQYPVQDTIASPIKPEEIRVVRPSLAFSLGPGGLTTHQFRAIPLGIMVRILNLILWCENLPKHLSISSVFARVLYKIYTTETKEGKKALI